MSDDISDIYYTLNIPSKLEIEPFLLNNKNIYNTIKTKTIELYEKKCCPYGYIDTIYKIIDYTNSKIVSENLNGNISYDIIYTARVCNPKINSLIECKIININKTLISCKNGPIIIIINSENINKTNFKINSNNQIIDSDTTLELQISNTVLIKILSSDYHDKDSSIFVYGFLEKKINDIK